MRVGRFCSVIWLLTGLASVFGAGVGELPEQDKIPVKGYVISDCLVYARPLANASSWFRVRDYGGFRYHVAEGESANFLVAIGHEATLSNVSMKDYLNGFAAHLRKVGAESVVPTFETTGLEAKYSIPEILIGSRRGLSSRVGCK